jgi:hypothetical protein
VLSAEQTACIMADANCVPPRWKDRFLAAVADRLFGLEPITTADIVGIAGRVRLVILGMPDE